MDVRNCRGCNRLFQYIGGQPLCPECRDKLENKFGEVKEYIYNNPGQTMAQVAEAMEISIKQIKQWVREERLVLSEPTADGIECERCGVPICSGRFCDKCKNQMTNDFSAAIKRPAAPQVKQTDRAGKHDNKMRFLS